MGISSGFLKSLLTMLFCWAAAVSVLDADECLEKARKAITRAYPAGGEILKFTGVDPVFAPLVDCEDSFMQKLPNFMHEMVRFAGFKTLGLGPDRMRVEASDAPRIYSVRADADLNDEGFFISAKEKIEVRKFVSPPRKIVFRRVADTCRENPNFEIFLTGDEAENGFLSLLGELHAYTHELKLVTALYPQTFPPGKRTVQKDFVLSAQLMVALYLAELRVAFPSVYKQVKANNQVVQLTKKIWLHAEAALKAVQDEAKYSKLRVTWPCVSAEIEKNKAEIEKFTGK